MISTSAFILFFQFSSIALKVAIGHKEDLAKSGYNTNREVENLGILYYLSANHLNLLFQYGDFI
jgi:hypothetical protein